MSPLDKNNTTAEVSKEIIKTEKAKATKECIGECKKNLSTAHENVNSAILNDPEKREKAKNIHNNPHPREKEFVEKGKNTIKELTNKQKIETIASMKDEEGNLKEVSDIKLTPEIEAYAKTLIATGITPKTSLNFTETTTAIIEQIMAGNKFSEDDGELTEIKRMIEVYLLPQITAKKLELKDKPEELADISWAKQSNDTYAFLTKEEIEDAKKAEKVTVTKNTDLKNTPSWVSEDFQKILSKTSENQENYKKNVNEYIEKSLFLTMLNNFFGGNIASIIQSNSFLGRAIRAFTDVPTPTENQSPIAGLKSTKKQKAEFAKRALGHIKTLKTIIPKEDLTKFNTFNTRDKITKVITKGFGEPPAQAILNPPQILQTKKINTMRIKTTSQNQFADIYSFLQTSNENEGKNLQKLISTKTKPGTPLGDVASYATGMIGSVQKEVKKIGADTTSASKGIINMFAQPSEYIESGQWQYGAEKARIGFPSGLNIKTTITGDILVTWEEDTSAEKAQKPKKRSEKKEKKKINQELSKIKKRKETQQ